MRRALSFVEIRSVSIRIAPLKGEEERNRDGGGVEGSGKEENKRVQTASRRRIMGEDLLILLAETSLCRSGDFELLSSDPAKLGS